LEIYGFRRIIFVSYRHGGVYFSCTFWDGARKYEQYFDKGKSIMKNKIDFPAELDRNIQLKDDLELLNIMVKDSKNQDTLYKPGPYWITQTENAVNEIIRCGIADFRGSSNLIGLSFADNLLIDSRNRYNHGLKRLARWLTRTQPLSKIYESQVRWTESYAFQNIIYAQEILHLKEKTRNLLKKYTVPYSLLGHCLSKAEIDGHEYSIHYLNLLEQHDNIASRIKFNDAYSIFEIGGGFGTNIHLLLENYKNIRKVLYLDIPPNLYVGTQYLKAFYGTAVFDYRSLKHLDSIKFSANDDIEIFCIAPWQIEKFKSGADILMNSHSFVEMPQNVVKNYVDKFNRFHDSMNSAIALTTYDGFDLSTTFHPKELPKFFENWKFDYFEVETLLNSSKKNLFFVSPGKLSF
jgi:putative sugar O-methyltransferase